MAKSKGKNIGSSELEPVFEWISHAAISAGMDASEYLRVARRAYAKAGAEISFGSGRKKKVSFSRVSALTGLARKEIPDLLQNENLSTEVCLTPVWSVISEWRNSADYVDSNSKPKIIPVDGDFVSLSSLVRRMSPDISCSAILKEMRRLGLVSERNDGMVSLTPDVVKYRNKSSADFQEFVKRVSTFSESAYQARGGERYYFNEALKLEGMPEKLAQMFLRDFFFRAQAFLDAVPKWRDANVIERSDAQNTDSVGVGVYLIDSRRSKQKNTTNPLAPTQRPTRRAKRA